MAADQENPPGDDDADHSRVTGASGPGDPGYVESQINTSGGEASVALEERARRMAEDPSADPALANADPSRVRDGQVQPAPPES
ncbi:MAG: hypothetical protein M3R01_02485 [Actinomycetota bacterium]|nr:hypothetical protein [Actinomycetota bacterium]